MTDTLLPLAAVALPLEAAAPLEFAAPLAALAPLAAFSLSGLAAKTLSLLWVALGLGLVIFFHELGHFAVAKWCGVTVERFSIGFGPVLFSKTRGETEYALSAFPLGGYVKMLGQDDIDPSQLTSDEIAEDPGSYSSKPVWQRMAIISAGVIMNLITAVLFFAIALWLGLWAAPPVIGDVTTGGPAWTAGVEAGDRLSRVNGREVDSFSDVALAIALSWGDTLRLEGDREDGAPLDLTLVPDDTGLRRAAGFTSSAGLTLGATSEDSDDPTVPGTPAAAVADQLLPGDKLVAARVLPAPADPAQADPAQADDENAEADEPTGEPAAEPVPLDSFAEYVAVVGAAADRPIEFFFERPDEDDPDAEPETVSVTVDPMPVRTFGFRVAPQPIAAIRAGSPAEEAGLQVGDELDKVDGLKIWQDLDPLRLPNFFYERAGEPVELQVVRTGGGGGGPKTISVTMTPGARPGWVSRPAGGSEPLDVPALGIAFHLNPVVSDVTPGGPADRAGLRANDKILAVTFTAADGTDDADGEARDPITVPFENDKVEDWNPSAYVFTLAQRFPTDTLTMKVQREDGEEETVTLAPTAAEDWYFPTRGFRMQQDRMQRKSDSAADALADGLKETRTVVDQMYLTLGSLLTGRLSIKNLRGPPGIVSEGMKIAESGPAQFLAFLGFLSVNLAVLNFLPIPVLDGGHMVWLIWEGVTRKKPNENLVIAATYVGLAMIILLMLTVMYLDFFVHNVFGGG